jgi:DNA-directed RNA polymerase alpha subunit
MSPEAECKRCRFWVQQAAEDPSGQCRRFPPTVPHTPEQQKDVAESGAGVFTGVWPETLGVDWCGEFQAKEPVPTDGPVADLGLSGRSLGCLQRAGISTVGALVGRTAADLLAIRNFGDACLREVQQKLAAKGLALRSP